LDYHTDPEEAAKAAQEAGATQLVYYHIVPQLPVKMLESIFLGESKSLFEGKITVGQDGMIFSLPVGTDEIKRREGL
jgi:ribonuclease Z